MWHYAVRETHSLFIRLSRAILAYNSIVVVLVCVLRPVSHVLFVVRVIADLLLTLQSGTNPLSFIYSSPFP